MNSQNLQKLEEAEGGDQGPLGGDGSLANPASLKEMNFYNLGVSNSNAAAKEDGDTKNVKKNDRKWLSSYDIGKNKQVNSKNRDFAKVENPRPDSI